MASIKSISSAAAALGRIKSKAKTEAARKNGRLGGRPPGAFCILDTSDRWFSICTAGLDHHNLSLAEANQIHHEWTVMYPARKLFVARVSAAILRKIIHSQSDAPLEIYRAGQ
jgi:hypothetical protein